MTFDEWFRSKGYDECHRELMQVGWEAARRLYEATTVPTQSPVHTITLGDIMRTERRRAAELNMPPQVGDVWVVKVRGGRIESPVVIVRTDHVTVTINDPPRYLSNRGSRDHRIENLEFLQLLTRGLK